MPLLSNSAGDIEAAASNGGKHAPNLGGGEDNFGVGKGFLERFQECVGGAVIHPIHPMNHRHLGGRLDG